MKKSSVMEVILKKKFKKDLCSGEEDVIRDVANSAGDDAQGHPGEHVGVVSLSGIERASVGQRHLAERTPASEDPATLIARTNMKAREP